MKFFSIALWLVGVSVLLVLGQGCKDLDSPSSLLEEESTPGSTPIQGEASSPTNAEVSEPTEIVDPFTEPTLLVDRGESLPPLSTSEVSTLTTEAQTQGQTWFDLAGLDKMMRPPAFSEELQAFRAEWQVSNPIIAPYLGRWHDGASAGQLYTLTIFPAETPDQVCVLEYRPGWKVVEDVILEPIFSLSKATVTEKDFLSRRLRSTSTALRQETFFTGDTVAFFDVLDDGGQGHVFALESPSALPIDLTPNMLEAVSQASPELGCRGEELFNEAGTSGESSAPR
ncbi:MAG: hypothetical protein OHK0012_15670 [Synechococcales cyanobacterium]